MGESYNEQGKCCFFGASKLGEIAEIKLRDEYEIICYCDNDPNKRGEKLGKYDIISFEDYLKNYRDKKIIITSQFSREIISQLTENGIRNYEILPTKHVQSSLTYHKKMKEINLATFIDKYKEQLVLKELTFLTGSSGVLDYLFLKLLAIEFKVKNYLEIGSFIGESISVLSDVVEKCHSISLPNEVFDEFFARRGMCNFCGFLLKNKQNIVEYKEDSKTFDYNIIKEKIDMVFIDGDHSYNGVYIDTDKIFSHVDLENCIVVWHDFKTGGKYRLPVIDAVFDAVPEKYHENIFTVSNNMCGIYLPDKYRDRFNYDKERDVLFTYNVVLESNPQRI